MGAACCLALLHCQQCEWFATWNDAFYAVQAAIQESVVNIKMGTATKT